MVSSCSQVIFQALGFDFFFPSMSMVLGRFCGCQELVICFYFGGWDTLLPSYFIHVFFGFDILLSIFVVFLRGYSEIHKTILLPTQELWVKVFRHYYWVLKCLGIFPSACGQKFPLYHLQFSKASGCWFQ